MAKTKIVMLATAVVGAIGAVAAFLSNIDTITEKPAEIAANLGLSEPKHVPVEVTLADLSATNAANLIVGPENEAAVEFQKYVLIDGVYCVPQSALGHCPGDKEPTQKPSMTIEYTGEDSFVGPFAPAVPIFDIAAVRPDERDILITQQRLEYELIAKDSTPYLEMIGLDDNEGRIALVNHSREEIVSVDIRFRFDDVIPSRFIDEWETQHRDVTRARKFSKSLHLTSGKLFGKPRTDPDDFRSRIQILDLRDAILRAYPGSRFREYPWLTREEGRPPSLGLEGVEASWLPKPVEAMDDIDRESVKTNIAIMMVGEVVVKARSGSLYKSRFTTPIIVSTEKGYGAAGVTVDSKGVYVIGDQSPKGVVTKNVKFVLTDANPTIRSQVALLFKKSGRYKVRLMYSTPQDEAFMASEWITVQAFASPFFIDSYFSM